MKVTKGQLAILVETALNEGSEDKDIVKKIQVIIGEFPDEESASGKWSSQKTDPKWYSFINNKIKTPGWKEKHGDSSEEVISALGSKTIKWPKAAKIMTKSGISGMTGDPKGALNLLNWINQENPPEKLEVGLDGKTKEKPKPDKDEKEKPPVKFAKRGEDDLVVTSSGEKTRLEDYTRRRNKVHILVPAKKGRGIRLSGFKQRITRIKIVFKDRGTLRTHLSGKNIKKLKINKRLFKVTRRTKLDPLKKLILSGQLIPAYQGEDEDDALINEIMSSMKQPSSGAGLNSRDLQARTQAGRDSNPVGSDWSEKSVNFAKEYIKPLISNFPYLGNSITTVDIVKGIVKANALYNAKPKPKTKEAEDLLKKIFVDATFIVVPGGPLVKVVSKQLGPGGIKELIKLSAEVIENLLKSETKGSVINEKIKLTRKQLRKIVSEAVQLEKPLFDVIHNFFPTAVEMAEDMLYEGSHKSLMQNNKLLREIIRRQADVKGTVIKYLLTQVLPDYVNSNFDSDILNILNNKDYFFPSTKNYKLPKVEFENMVRQYVDTQPSLIEQLDYIKQLLIDLYNFNEKIISGQLDSQFISMTSTGDLGDYKNAFELYDIMQVI